MSEIVKKDLTRGSEVVNEEEEGSHREEYLLKTQFNQISDIYKNNLRAKVTFKWVKNNSSNRGTGEQMPC